MLVVGEGRLDNSGSQIGFVFEIEPARGVVAEELVDLHVVHAAQHVYEQAMLFHRSFLSIVRGMRYARMAS